MCVSLNKFLVFIFLLQIYIITPATSETMAYGIQFYSNQTGSCFSSNIGAVVSFKTACLEEEYGSVFVSFNNTHYIKKYCNHDCKLCSIDQSRKFGFCEKITPTYSVQYSLKNPMQSIPKDGYRITHYQEDDCKGKILSIYTSLPTCKEMNISKETFRTYCKDGILFRERYIDKWCSGTPLEINRLGIGCINKELLECSKNL